MRRTRGKLKMSREGFRRNGLVREFRELSCATKTLAYVEDICTFILTVALVLCAAIDGYKSKVHDLGLLEICFNGPPTM